MKNRCMLYVYIHVAYKRNYRNEIPFIIIILGLKCPVLYDLGLLHIT